MPTNEQRASWGGQALQGYLKAAPGLDTGDMADNVVDCVGDLLHFAAAGGVDVERVLRLAQMHFEAEREGED